MKMGRHWLFAGMLALGISLIGCTAKEEPEEKGRVGPSVLTAPADYVHASFQAGEKAKATLGLMTLNKAVTQYRALKGSNPPSLQALKEQDMLADIPPAPVGQKYQYNPRSGKVTLVAK